MASHPRRQAPRSESASQHSRGSALAEVFSALQSQPPAVSSGRLHLRNRVAVFSVLQEALVADLEAGEASLATTTTINKTTNSQSHSHSAILPLLREHLGQVETLLVQTTLPTTLAAGFSATRLVPLLVSSSNSRLSRTHLAVLVKQTKTRIRPPTLLSVALLIRSNKNKILADFLVTKTIPILEADYLAT